MAKTALGVLLVLGKSLVADMAPQKPVSAEESRDQIMKSVQGFKRQLKEKWKIKASTARGRRLQIDAIDYSNMCEGGCWTSVKSGFISWLRDEEDYCPQLPTCTTSTGTTLTTTTTTTTIEECMFDLCTQHLGGYSFFPTMQDLCNAGWKKTFTQLLNLPPQLFDNCTNSAFNFICDSVCTPACISNSTEVRKIFCAPPDPNEDGRRRRSNPNCGTKDDGAEAMVPMLNFMCMQNPSNGRYCFEGIHTWATAGAFKDYGSNSALFPDPCSVDCSTTSGQAVQDMGCCVGEYIRLSQLSPDISITKNVMIALRTYVFRCVGQTGFNLCSSSNLIAPAAVISGSYATSTCPSTTTASQTMQCTIAGQISTSTFTVPCKVVALLACTAGGSNCQAGGGGRRLSGTSTVSYTVSLQGAAATQATAVLAQATALTTNATNQNSGPSPPGSGLTSQSISDSMKLIAALLIGYIWLHVS